MDKHEIQPAGLRPRISRRMLREPISDTVVVILLGVVVVMLLTVIAPILSEEFFGTVPNGK